MSVEAITWALKQPVEKSSTKFVLVVLANCAGGDNWEAYPSVAYLAEATGQDRKTVLANMARLIAAGLIRDTGHRRGSTNQVIVYRLNPPSAAAAAPAQPPVEHQIEESQKRDSYSVEHFESEEYRNWDSSDGQTVPFFPANSTVFPFEQSQKRDTEPSLNHQETASPHTTAADAPTGVCGTTPGLIAASLNRAAMAAGRSHQRITSQHPDLIAAAAEGVTAKHLLELSDLYPDKPAGYLIAAARRQHAAGATAIAQGGTPHAVHRESTSERTRRLAKAAVQREADADAARGRPALDGFDRDAVGSDG